VWATGTGPLTTNAEIVRVTNVVGDTLTIVRAQEGTAARAIVSGDQFANTITAKCLTDIESATGGGGGCNVSNSGTPVANQLAMWTSATVIQGETGLTTDGAGKIIHGVAGSVVGTIDFKNATSGTITLSPVTGALGSVTLSLPAATDTLVGKATTDTLTNKTLTGAVINGATSSGSTAINLSGNSGTYSSPTGANTFGGSSNTFTNGITAPTFIGALTGNATTATALSSASSICIAYLSSIGNDSTAVLGNISKPYLTPTAAYNALLATDSEAGTIFFLDSPSDGTAFTMDAPAGGWIATIWLAGNGMGAYPSNITAQVGPSGDQYQLVITAKGNGTHNINVRGLSVWFTTDAGANNRQINLYATGDMQASMDCQIDGTTQAVKGYTILQNFGQALLQVTATTGQLPDCTLINCAAVTQITYAASGAGTLNNLTLINCGIQQSGVYKTTNGTYGGQFTASNCTIGIFGNVSGGTTYTLTLGDYSNLNPSFATFKNCVLSTRNPLDQITIVTKGLGSTLNVSDCTGVVIDDSGSGGNTLINLNGCPGYSLSAALASGSYISGYGRVTAQTAGNITLAKYVVGSADSTYRISANMNVTAATALSTNITCQYTDESGTSRMLIMPVTQLSGSFIAVGAITGTGVWETPSLHIRAKAYTNILIKTKTGTFTSVTYTAEGWIVPQNL
jgi:hypothetical protein